MYCSVLEGCTTYINSFLALQNPDQARLAMENGATVAGGAELVEKVSLAL